MYSESIKCKGIKCSSYCQCSVCIIVVVPENRFYSQFFRTRLVRSTLLSSSIHITRMSYSYGCCGGYNLYSPKNWFAEYHTRPTIWKFQVWQRKGQQNGNQLFIIRRIFESGANEMLKSSRRITKMLVLFVFCYLNKMDRFSIYEYFQIYSTLLRLFEFGKLNATALK